MIYLRQPMKLTKESVEAIADVLHGIRMELRISDGHGKTYDPLEIEDNIAHTYVFDLEDGGRHHPIKDLPDLVRQMFEETVRNIKEEIEYQKSSKEL